MIRIDLLPKEERARRRKVPTVPTVRVRVPVRATTFLGLAIVILVAFLLAFAYFRQRAEIGRLNSDITRMQQELRKLENAQRLVKQYEARQKNIELWLSQIQKLNQNRFLRAHFLDEVCSLLPDYAWFSSLRESAAALSIEGVAFSNMIVADFMTKLASSPYFSNIELIYVKRAAMVAGRHIMQFSLSGSLVPHQPQTEGAPKAAEGS